MRTRTHLQLLTLLAGVWLHIGCNRPSGSARIDYQMGERVAVGPLIYNVLDTSWRSQLGEMFQLRVPTNRFLILSLSVTNSGGNEASFPMLRLENASGQSFPELDRGDGVDSWMGILRNLNPAQTLQGKILFDVTPNTYKLRVTDGGDIGNERSAFIEIPLRMDPDAPLTSLPGKK
jgi:hypothetical protein